jgi:hypothetical protein
MNLFQKKLAPCNAVKQTYYPAGESHFCKHEHILFTPVIMDGDGIYREEYYNGKVIQRNHMELTFLENGTAIAEDMDGLVANYFCTKRINGKAVDLPIRVFPQDNPFFYISQPFLDRGGCAIRTCVIWEPLLSDCADEENTIDTCYRNFL